MVAANNALKPVEHRVRQNADSESRADRHLLRNGPIDYGNRFEKAAIDFAGGDLERIQEIGPRAKPVGMQFAALVAGHSVTLLYGRIGVK